jgi:DNA-directed RNA polymerase II subunit RPB2
VHEVYDDGFEHDPGYAYDVKAEADQKPALGDDEYEDEGDMLKQDDYWLVINTFFEDKGLVRQQLESFNEFVETTLQEVVDDNAQLLLDQHQQYTDNEKDVSVREREARADG